MTWRLSLVPTDGVKALWPTVAPMLAPAVRHTAGRSDLRALFEELSDQRQLLWVVLDDTTNTLAAALTTREAHYARRHTLVVDFVGGRGMRSWIRLVSDTFRAYARDAGLSGVEMCGRRGWAKVLKSCGWQQNWVVMEVGVASGLEG